MVWRLNANKEFTKKFRQDENIIKYTGQSGMRPKVALSFKLYFVLLSKIFHLYCEFRFRRFKLYCAYCWDRQPYVLGYYSSLFI